MLELVLFHGEREISWDKIPQVARFVVKIQRKVCSIEKGALTELRFPPPLRLAINASCRTNIGDKSHDPSPEAPTT